jgi:N-dimethylarginine dimethylaminohydrolase
MGATFLMSYPGPGWTIRGGQNFRSKTRAATNPRAAMHEWLALCDAITRHGGRILVMAPPPADGAAPAASLTGLPYTANSGAMFRTGDQWTWRLPKMLVAHRQAEQPHIRAFWADAGVPVEESAHTWEGQADLTTLPGNRFVLSWGVRSARESVAAVRERLPMGARVVEVQLREPWFHGDTALDLLTTRAGDATLLAFGGALVDRTLPDLATFIGNAEVISVDEDDALGYACNSLCVDGTILMPAGLSTGLRGNLLRRGFKIEELELPELFGKGGGGPRCLVNELRGFVLTATAPDYVSQRDMLVAMAERYPESAA